MEHPQLIPRREALARLGALTLFSAGLWPGCMSSKASAGNGRGFRFIAVNDLHHASDACDPWFEAVVAQMRGHAGVEFVLVLGDIADQAAPASHASIRDHFKQLGVPVQVVVGNHDHKTDSDRASFEQTFPKQLNYHLEHRGWQFVALDSTQGTKADKTHVQPATIRWLDDTLPRLDRGRPLVLLTHFPLAAGVRMTPLNAGDVLDRFRDFNLRGVFGGHYHAYTERKFAGIDVVTNRCCSRVRGNHDGSKEKGYWLVTAEDGALRREFIEFKGV
jgi:hypothetical protein